MINKKGCWNKQDLTRRLCHALNIARQVVEQLASEGYRDTEESGNNVRPEKIISETAVLLLAASSVANNEKVRAEIDRVARLLIPHARGERMRLVVCLEGSLALDYALAHVCLRRLGYPDRDFDALIRLSLQSQARGGRERLPHRVLEQELTMRLWEGIKPPNAKRRQRTRSAVNQPLEPYVR